MQLKALFLPLSLALLALGVQAQTVYRIVGPDGKVTFSDRAPETPSKATQATAAASGATTASGAALPYELGKIAARFPVTVYTAKDCAPCDSVRRLLSNRGVPFTERLVNTNEDVAALQNLGGSDSLPFGTIGKQQLSGFSESEWTQYLDAAGYPKTSQLPTNYKRTAATPLTQPKAAAAPESSASSTANQRPQRPTVLPAESNAPNPNNPAGLKF